MIPIRQFAGREVAVFGLTRGGLEAARALLAGGAKVHAWDDSEAARAKAASEGLALSDINARDWRDIAALVVSPSVQIAAPKAHRIVELARAVGAPVLGDVELLAQEAALLAPHARPRIVGVVGALGDFACAKLLGQILVAAGKDARVGGEGGPGALSLGPLHAGAVFILALSPAQLALSETLRCDVVVLLDPAPSESKFGKVLANQGAGDWTILSVDASEAAALCTRLTARGGARIVPISALQALGRGVSALGPHLYDAVDGLARRVVDLHGASPAEALRSAAAYGAALALGLAPRAIGAAMNAHEDSWALEQASNRGRP